MRKFFYLLTIGIFFALCGCQSKIDFACKSAKTIAKCCHGIKMTKNSFLNRAGNQTTEAGNDVFAPLPLYSWDSKMMFY